MFLLPFLMCFHCYGNLKFPVTYNGKSENSLLLLSHCRYFDKAYTEMILDKSSAKHIIFFQTSEIDWLPWQQEG